MLRIKTVYKVASVRITKEGILRRTVVEQKGTEMRFATSEIPKFPCFPASPFQLSTEQHLLWGDL
jgi:hypothetical protein